MTEEQSAKQVASIIEGLAETEPGEYVRMVHLVTSMNEAQPADFLARCHETLNGAGVTNEH